MSTSLLFIALGDGRDGSEWLVASLPPTWVYRLNLASSLSLNSWWRVQRWPSVRCSSILLLGIFISFDLTRMFIDLILVLDVSCYVCYCVRCQPCESMNLMVRIKTDGPASGVGDVHKPSLQAAFLRGSEYWNCPSKSIMYTYCRGFRGQLHCHGTVNIKLLVLFSSSFHFQASRSWHHRQKWNSGASDCTVRIHKRRPQYLY